MGNVCSADVGPVFPTFKLYIENAKNLVGERDKVVETYVKISFWDMRSLPKQKHRVVKKMKELSEFAHKTSVIKATDPTWKEIFVINDLPATYSLLRVEVFEKCAIRSDNFLGKVRHIYLGKQYALAHTHTHTHRLKLN